MITESKSSKTQKLWLRLLIIEVSKSKKRGFTETYLLLIKDADCNTPVSPGKLLEQANVLCFDDSSGENTELRVGTSEVTRRGMREEYVRQIADYLKRVLIDNEAPGKVKQDVIAFTSQFNHIAYAIRET